jgi:hypothetical protein
MRAAPGQVAVHIGKALQLAEGGVPERGIFGH